MDLEHISQMVSALCASRSVTELSVRRGATRLVVRRALVTELAAAPEPAPAEEPAAPSAELRPVRSPLVGIFHHRASSSQEPIGVGAAVREGQVLGAIESMRMLYDVASGLTGAVAEVLVEDGQPVEYGQELFRVKVAP